MLLKNKLNLKLLNIISVQQFFYYPLMKKIKLQTEIFEYESDEVFSSKERQLIKECRQIVKNAYAPYSKFNVGAAVLLENGEIVSGTNQENAAYPSGMCAERVAIFYANSKYPEVPVKSIVICAFFNGKYIETPVPPCGSCRQVLLESETRFKTPIKIILLSKIKITVIKDAKMLLPLTFDEHFLES